MKTLLYLFKSTFEDDRYISRTRVISRASFKKDYDIHRAELCESEKVEVRAVAENVIGMHAGDQRSNQPH